MWVLAFHFPQWPRILSFLLNKRLVLIKSSWGALAARVKCRSLFQTDYCFDPVRAPSHRHCQLRFNWFLSNNPDFPCGQIFLTIQFSVALLAILKVCWNAQTVTFAWIYAIPRSSYIPTPKFGIGVVIVPPVSPFNWITSASNYIYYLKKYSQRHNKRFMALMKH